jgi:hypothetical protein
VDKQSGLDLIQQTGTGVPPQVLAKVQQMILFLDFIKIP